jgi:hypothetical protein
MGQKQGKIWRWAVARALGPAPLSAPASAEIRFGPVTAVHRLLGE